LLRKKYARPSRLRSEDYKTRIPAQATIRDVAAILFAKQSTCEICIIDIVHFQNCARVR